MKKQFDIATYIYVSCASIIVAMLFIMTAHALQWQDTATWISNKSVIRSDYTKNNFDYLYNIVATGGIRAGNFAGACNSDNTGVIRFTSSRNFEVCNGTSWSALTPPNQACASCTIVEQTQACNIAYSCNCGKNGCGTCYRSGSQHRIDYSCPSISGQSGWSACQ